MTDYATLRRTMVDNQIRTFDVHDRALLAAMDEVPREVFAPPGQEGLAYSDRSLAFPGMPEDPRVMLAPMVLARLLQALAIEPQTRALDVASGTGYAAAVMARLGARVVSLETRTDLVEARDRILASGVEGAGRIRAVAGPLDSGVPGEAAFGVILINGAVETRPARLLDRLAEGGRLVCLSTEGRVAKAVVYVRSGDAFGFRSLFDAAAPALAAFRQAPAFVF